MKRVHLLLAIVALVAVSMLLMSTALRPDVTMEIAHLISPTVMPHWELNLQKRMRSQYCILRLSHRGTAIVTFLVPTVNRPTLNRTLQSLREQTSSRWRVCC
jgi:hypothetical protein